VEARLAKVEAAVEHIQTDNRDIKQDLRDLSKKVDNHLYLVLAAGAAAAIGLAGVMAKGFNWL